MKCLREDGGAKMAETGCCPASTETRLDGINRGKNAGRACWAVPSTLCAGKPSGTFVAKITECLQCKFYKLVLQEEGKEFTMTKEIFARLKQMGN